MAFGSTIIVITPVSGSMRRTFDAAPIFPSFPSRNRRCCDAPFGSFGVDFLCRSFIAFALTFRFSRLVRRRAARHRSSFSPARFASDLAPALNCLFKLDVMLKSFAALFFPSSLLVQFD
jgi:hypothetical protein